MRPSVAVLSGVRNYHVDSYLPLCLVGWWQVGFGEECSDGVFRADRGWDVIQGFEGPGDVEGGIVPEDRAFSGGVVEVGGLVEDFCSIGEDEEAVGEAFGNPEELEVVGGGLSLEVEAGPFAKVGRAAAEVDGDVPDMTGEDADQFTLRVAKLIMQTAEYALDGKGLVVLNESGG